MPANNNLLSLPASITTLAKVIEAIGILDDNIDLVNRSAFGRDTIPRKIYYVDANFSLDLLPHNDIILAITSAVSPGAISITMPLPENCRPGQRITLYDRSLNSHTYNTTLLKNGNLFDGVDDDIVLDVAGIKVSFICIASGEWMSDV